MRLFFIICLAGFFYTTLRAGSIHVPSDQATIQQAIDAAQEGDTVLVAPGEYFENILFKGKNIVVASEFILNHDYKIISKTVINGSKPANSQNASCVRIISGEDSSTVLEGFTLTGGQGTLWEDEHGAGTYYEGGGILITLSSPTIRFNIIRNNQAIKKDKNSISSGGGGIRIGDGSPLICNNVISDNKGMYGGGIVCNYSSAVIKNNIITNNRVYQADVKAPTFGGGGVWAYARGPNIIENNTIYGNSSKGQGSVQAGYGGGILLSSTSAVVRNNIVWNNSQDNGKQLHQIGALLNSFYNDIEDGFEGEGNISMDPIFIEGHFLLAETSPCIDGGDINEEYNDPADTNNKADAAFPSKGMLRNDMGAYGGPLRSDYEMIVSAVEPAGIKLIPSKAELYQNYPNPFNPLTRISFKLSNPAYVTLKIYNTLGVKIETITNGHLATGLHSFEFDASQLSAGVYIYKLQTGDNLLVKKMIYIP